MQRTMIEEDRRGRFGDFAIIFLLVGGHRNDESVHISHQLSPSLSSAKLHCGCAPHMASCAAAFSSSSLIGARSGVAIDQRCPNGSSTCPQGSPQNMSCGYILRSAPAIGIASCRE